MSDEVEVEKKEESGLYIIVESYDYCSGLEKLVNEKLFEGYIPLGGVCVTANGNYIQAMIHEDL